MNERISRIAPLRRGAIAALLSFLIPGAGLWWLGHRRLAVVNLLAATVFVGAFWMILGGVLSENVHYLVLMAAAASAGVAHASALRMPVSAFQNR